MVWYDVVMIHDVMSLQYDQFFLNYTCIYILGLYNEKIYINIIYIYNNLCTIYSTCAHIATFYSACNEPVHAEYNLSTRLCLTYIYSTVSSQPIHSYQQSYKVVSNLCNSLLTTYTQLPTTSPQGCV